MKRFVATIAAALALAGAAPMAAQAAPWQSINQRQENMRERIQQGVRSGELTRAEADRLRDQFRDLARLEAQYRRSGGQLTDRERRELDRRFDTLSHRIANQKHDLQDRHPGRRR